MGPITYDYNHFNHCLGVELALRYVSRSKFAVLKMVYGTWFGILGFTESAIEHKG
jgi:hypothetical protein